MVNYIENPRIFIVVYWAVKTKPCISFYLKRPLKKKIILSGTYAKPLGRKSG